MVFTASVLLPGFTERSTVLCLEHEENRAETSAKPSLLCVAEMIGKLLFMISGGKKPKQTKSTTS